MDRDTGTGDRATLTVREVGIAAAVAALLVIIVIGRDDSPGDLLGNDGLPTAAPAPEMVEPIRLVIPSIEVDAAVQPTGVEADGAVEVPPLDEPQLVGWYQEGPSPGQSGSAVLLGHLTTPERGVFFDLASLDVGARIEVGRADGSVAVFAVDRVDSIPKSAFPVAEVYGPADGAAVLRLVTCGGDVDEQTREYSGSVIAYASLVEWRD